MSKPNLNTVNGIIEFCNTYDAALIHAKVKPLDGKQRMILQGLFAGFMTAEPPINELNKVSAQYNPNRSKG